MKKKNFKFYSGRRALSIVVCVVLMMTSMATVVSISGKQAVSSQMMGTLQKEPSVTSTDGPVEITVITSNDVIQLTYHMSDFTQENVQINNREYSAIVLVDESTMEEKGMPDLPNICRSIIIPDDAKMTIRVTNAQYTEYDGVQVAPSKGVILRTVNPAEVPYGFDAVYTQDAMFPGVLATLGDPYILRDYRGQVVTIYPFQYNPVQNILRWYSDITVEIYPGGTDTVNCLVRSEQPSVIDGDFQQIYEQHFLNFGGTRYQTVGEQGNMLVITYDAFWDNMVPFMQWKNMKGVPTEMVRVSQIGSATAIRTYISNYYYNHGLTFVLLVGDAQQVPTLTASGGASDPSYSYIVGSDHYPDLFVGRFSAQNTAQVDTQVQRSIEYEKYPQVGGSWYQKGVGIASNEGTGDDGEYDWQHMRNIRTDLLNYYYTLVDELYDGSHGGGDASGNPLSSMVSSAVNNGRGIINYCGHGSATAWGTTGFSTTSVNALTNDNMLPFIWTVACNNGEFNNYATCFAEAWLRATHNGEPTGAIAMFASSISQSWSPPMDAQDEMVDILVESYATNKKYTFGAISFCGCMHMNDQYGAAGYAMTDTWHVFGDPSLQVRTDTPASMNVDHETFIPAGSSVFEVDVPGVANALCAVSYDYALLGYAYTDASGHAVITFESPLPTGETVDLVVTAYNKIPYMTTVSVLSVLGDLDGDGDIDLSDLATLLANYGITSGATYEMGDLDGDGDVDLEDLGILLGNYGYVS